MYKVFFFARIYVDFPKQRKEKQKQNVKSLGKPRLEVQFPLN